MSLSPGRDRATELALLEQRQVVELGVMLRFRRPASPRSGPSCGHRQERDHGQATASTTRTGITQPGPGDRRAGEIRRRRISQAAARQATIHSDADDIDTISGPVERVCREQPVPAVERRADEQQCGPRSPVPTSASSCIASATRRRAEHADDPVAGDDREQHREAGESEQSEAGRAAS